MIDKFSSARVDTRLFELFSDLSWIKDKVGEFIQNPTAEAAQDVDGLLVKFASDSEALRNAVTTLAKEVAGVDVDEKGEMEIDVIPEENGLRLT